MVVWRNLPAAGRETNRKNVVRSIRDTHIGGWRSRGRGERRKDRQAGSLYEIKHTIW